MDTTSKRQERRHETISALDLAIEATNLMKETASVASAKPVFASVSILLVMIRDSMADKLDYVQLGLVCAEVCRALDRGVGGKKQDDLSQSAREVIARLTRAVAEIQRKVIKQSKRNAVSRLVHATNDKETFAAWKSDLRRTIQALNTELAMNLNVAFSNGHQHITGIDTHRTLVEHQEGTSGKIMSTQARSAIPDSMVSAVLPLDSIPPGELPPPAPRACFGRDELIERIVDLAENLTPFALIGPGGIGKTSIALTVLHHDRIKGQFGNDRWFIRCDRFPASLNRFLSQLSRVTGAGIENPEDLTPLRPFLSSRKMIIFLDNAESLLDPQGTDAREIYTVVEELSQFETICLGITSRISIIPRYCKRLVIPTLSLQSACDTFYDIYDNGSRSDIIGNLLKQLDFHALSIVSLATIASQNMWNYGRLAREWNAYHTEILQKDHNEGLTTTIELSLASPTFRELGPIARDVLGVVAFFPQGINENSLDWLFPTIPDRSDVFNKLSVLSLTHQRDGFITMLAPFRDYLRPKDPTSFPLLHAVKEQYFSRLSVHVDPDKPGFEEARWITSEDENVEHLLNVFTSTDVNSASAWDACAYFMRHLSWHKPRLVVLGPKIEGLPDDHRSKPRCLFELSRLFDSVGHFVQGKRLLTHTLNLWKERGDDLQVAQTLRFLSNTNRLLGLHKEGIAQAEEAFGIYERFDNVVGQAQSLQHLAWLLYGDNQLDAAETAASQAIDLFLNKGEQFLVCRCYRALGNICQSLGKTEEAIDHFETALRLGFPFNWDDEQSRNHYSLARLFLGENKFDNARVHVERAKSYALNDPYLLGCAMELQARLWYKQRRLKDAKSEALRATDTFERLGATKELKYCRRILRNIVEETKKPVASYESDSTVRGTGR